MDPALYIFLAFIIGTMVGSSLANARWRQNAKDIMRMESGGRLYKVYRLESGQWSLSNNQYSKACAEMRHD